MSSHQITNLVAHSYDSTVADSFAELFKYQIALSKTPIATSASWRMIPVGPWILHHCPLLRVTPILDARLNTIGQFIGVGIDAIGDAVMSALHIDAMEGSVDFWSALERKIETIAGRYALVAVSGNDQRMYFDNALDQSVVFNSSEDLVASSTGLAATAPLQDNPHFDCDAILTSKLYFGFEHTRDQRVKRARPNHFLDLSSYELVRHWPGEHTSFDAPRNMRFEVIDQIEQRLHQIVTGLIKNFDCCLPVSGGKDSRLLLGLAKNQLDDLSCVFTHATNHNSLVDTYVASKLCERLGISHNVVDVKSGAHDDLLTEEKTARRFARFAFRTGFQSGTRDPRIGLAEALSPKHEVLLRGNLLGLIAAQQYRTSVLGAPFDIAYALERLRIAPTVNNSVIKRWGPSYFDWMRSLPDAASERIYDLAFLELVQPHALGALLSGQTNSYYVNPFNDRTLLHNTMRLRPKYRYSGRAYEILLKRAAPEFTDIPFTHRVKHGVVRKLGVAPNYSVLKETPLTELI